MSYFPYFGEEHRGGDWSGDIDNLFEDHTKQEAERNLEAETHARLYCSTEKLLEDVGCTKFDIVHHHLDNLPNHSRNKSAMNISKDEMAALSFFGGELSESRRGELSETLPPKDSLRAKAAALLCKAFYNIHRLYLSDIVKKDAKISALISPGKHLPTTPGRPRLFTEPDLSSLETQTALSCLVCLKLAICVALFLAIANLNIGMNVKCMVSRLFSNV